VGGELVDRGSDTKLLLGHKTVKKGKCAVVPVITIKVYWGRRGIAPLILNLGTT
jgi:hypothetical protein